MTTTLELAKAMLATAEKATRGAWFTGSRSGRYDAVPANDAERTALESIGHIHFEALSIGTTRNQIAIIPLDESTRDNADHIVATSPEKAKAVAEALLEAVELLRKVDDSDHIDNVHSNLLPDVAAFLTRIESEVPA